MRRRSLPGRDLLDVCISCLQWRVVYKTLTAQTIHYFARPHTDIARDPLDVAAAWKGRDLARNEDWYERLSEAELLEIDEALACAKRTGKRLGSLTKHDFPLPTLSSKIARWRDEVQMGRGFQVIRGVPVERWTDTDSEIFFWCFGQHLGIPGAQNPEGDLLGHVRDTGQSPDRVRHYRTRVNINFHCDAADLVGLLCLQKAKHGGRSRIVSSVSVYNELLRSRPDMVARLYEPFMMDTKGEGGVRTLPVIPCRFDSGRLRTFYHTDYFRSAAGWDGRPLLNADDRAVLDLYNEIADRPDLHLDMDLEPGDIQLLSNHTVLHSRTGYEDYPEPDRKRHLLRLWVSLPSRRTWRTRLRTEQARLQMLARALRSKMEYALRRAVH